MHHHTPGPHTYDQDFSFYRQAARQGKDRFGYFGALSAKAQTELRRIVETARGHGIKVVLLLNPYPHAVWSELQDNPEQRRFYAEAEAATARIARETGAELHVFHDLAQLGLDDRSSLDGIHVDEVASLRQMLAIIESSPILGGMVDGAALTPLRAMAADASAFRRHIVFP